MAYTKQTETMPPPATHHEWRLLSALKSSQGDVMAESQSQLRANNYDLRSLQVSTVMPSPNTSLREYLDGYKFNVLKERWRLETGKMSRLRDTFMSDPYQQIIGMGPKVLPLLFKELKESPDWWFWALKAITGVDPTSEGNRGNLTALTVEWLDWAAQNQLI